MVDIGIICILTLFASGLGEWLLIRLNIRSASRLKEFVYAATVGYLFLAGSIFCLGTLGVLYRSVFVSLLLILGALTWRDWWHWLRDAWRTGRSYSWASFSGGERALLVLIGLFAGSSLLMALSPPSSGYSIHYELPAAQMYVRAHRLHFIPYLFALRPQNMMLLHMVGLLCKADFPVQMFGAVFLWLTLLMVYALTRQTGTRLTGLFAVAIFLSMPMIGYVSGTVSSEPGVFLYGFLALCAVLEWWRTGQARWLILAGGFSGFCAGVKITGVEVPFVLGLFLLGRVWPFSAVANDATPLAFPLSFVQRCRVVVLAGGVFVAALAVTMLPWYYQIYHWTGSPLYSGENPDGLISRYFPQLEPATPSGNQTPTTQNASEQETSSSSGLLGYVQAAVASLTRFGPRTLLEFVWKMSMCRDFQNIPISPLFLAFLPFLVLFRRPHQGLGMLSLFSVVYFVIGLNLWGDYNRYIIPVFPGLAVLTAISIGNIAQANRRLGQFCQVVAVGMMGLYLPVALHTGLRQGKVVVGWEERAAYLNRLFPGSFAAAEYVRQHVPTTAKLLLIGEANLFLFQREYVLGDGTPETLDFQFSLIMQYRHFHDPTVAYERLKQLGVTHVILNQHVSNNSGYRDTLKYVERFTQLHLEEIFHEAEVFIYRLK